VNATDFGDIAVAAADRAWHRHLREGLPFLAAPPALPPAPSPSATLVSEAPNKIGHSIGRRGREATVTPTRVGLPRPGPSYVFYGRA